MENFKKILFCPAYPAFMLMFGLTILFQLTFLLDINWSRQITVSFYVVIFIWLLIIMMNTPRDSLEINLLDYCLVGLIGLITISLIWVNRFDSLLESPLKYIVGLMMIPFICGRLMNRESVICLVKIIISVSCIEALFFLFYLRPNLDSHDRQNLFDTGHGYLLAGEFLAVAIIAVISNYLRVACLSYKVQNFNTAKVLALPMLLAILLVWTGARGYKYCLIISILFSLVIFFRLEKYGSRSYYLNKCICVILMLLVASYYAIDSRDTNFNGYNQLNTLIELNSDTVNSDTVNSDTVNSDIACPLAGSNSFEIRSFMHVAAVKLFIQFPIFGIGADMFGSESCFGPGSHPHSTIIQSFTELGILGGGLLVFMFFYSFYVLINMLRVSKVKEHEESIVLDQVNNKKIIMFLIALLCFRLFSDQIYGNYFTSATTYLTFGMVSSMLNRINHGR